MACLDRYLVSSSWSSQYRTAHSYSFPRVCSDHSPISLEFRPASRFKSTIFRFEKCWLGQDGFSDLMTTWWNSMVLENNKALNWKFKLDKIRSKIKWHVNFRAQIRSCKQTLIQDISSLESVMEQQDLSDDEIFDFFELKNKLFSIYKTEEIYWQQRTRLLRKVMRIPKIFT
jgi:hypothetical protein